jgi:hypothetical protein
MRDLRCKIKDPIHVYGVIRNPPHPDFRVALVLKAFSPVAAGTDDQTFGPTPDVHSNFCSIGGSS